MELGLCVTTITFQAVNLRRENFWSQALGLQSLHSRQCTNRWSYIHNTMTQLRTLLSFMDLSGKVDCLECNKSNTRTFLRPQPSSELCVALQIRLARQIDQHVMKVTSGLAMQTAQNVIKVTQGPISDPNLDLNSALLYGIVLLGKLTSM